MEDKKVIQEKSYKHAYASFGLRLLAFLIDMLVVGALVRIASGLIPLGDKPGFYGLSLIDIVKLAITLAYFTVFSLVTRGQSLGKMIVGIRVVSLKGELSTGQILIREICGRYVQNKFMILYLFALFTEKNQTLMDLFTDTAVVKEEAAYDLYGLEF